MAKEKHSTFRFDDEIKEAFKEECYQAGVDMTETLEKMMVSFVKFSKNEREAK